MQHLTLKDMQFRISTLITTKFDENNSEKLYYLKMKHKPLKEISLKYSAKS